MAQPANRVGRHSRSLTDPRVGELSKNERVVYLCLAPVGRVQPRRRDARAAHDASARTVVGASSDDQGRGERAAANRDVSLAAGSTDRATKLRETRRTRNTPNGLSKT